MSELSNRTVVAPTAAGRATRAAALLAAFVAAYVFLDWLSYLHPVQPFRVTPWNPQAAVAIALLMLYGQRWLPAVVGTVLGADLLLHGRPESAVAAVSASLVLSLGYAGIAYALTRLLPVRRQFPARRDVVRLTAVVAGGTLLMGLVYIGALLAAGVGSVEGFPGAVLSFWVGQSVGILVTLPLLLMLSSAERRRQCRELLARGETAAQAAAAAAALWLVFGFQPDHFEWFYVLFLPLVWIAARSGMIGAAFGAMVIQSGVILGFYLAGDRPLEVFDLQGLLVALTITGFFLGVTVDERERAAAELRQSLKLAAAAETAAALAHELNQPLAALTTYSRASRMLARSPPDGGERLMETLAKLDGEARRAAEVVRRLRDFFRSGTRRTERVSLERLLEGVLDSLRDRAAAAGVVMRQAVHGRLPMLPVDPLQIEVVLRNLLTNALDAVSTAPAGARTVRVELRAERGREVCVRVLDSGPGIAPDQAERLFEAFASTKATGMGVGLVLSRAVVEAHGGRLWAVPGKSGEMCFTLPAPEDDHA